jgi:hypothetical protein
MPARCFNWSHPICKPTSRIPGPWSPQHLFNWLVRVGLVPKPLLGYQKSMVHKFWKNYVASQDWASDKQIK